MRGDRLGVVDLVGRVLEGVEHAVELVGELGALLHGLLQRLLPLPQADLEGIVPLVVGLDDVLHPVGVVLDDQAEEGAAGLVQAVQHGLVVLDGLDERPVDLLLLGDLVGAQARRQLVHALALHVAQPGFELVVGLVEVLGERQGLLQDAEAVVAQLDHRLHGLLEVVHLLLDLFRLTGLGGLAEDPLGVGEDVADAALLARDVIVQRLVLLQLHADHVRLRGGRVSLADLILDLSEPLQEFVNLSENLARLLLGELDPLAPALDLLADGVEPPVVPGDEVLDGPGAVSRRHLAELRSGQVDGLELGPVVLDVLLEALDLQFLVFEVERVQGLEDALDARHPLVEPVVVLVEGLHEGQHVLRVLEQLGGLARQVVVLTLQRVQLVLELNGLLAGDVLHELLAVVQHLVHAPLLRHDLLRDGMELLHLLDEFLRVDGQDLVLAELLLHALHPGEQVLVGEDEGAESGHAVLEQLVDAIRVADEGAVPVGQLLDLVGQALRVAVADDLHEGGGDVGHVVEGRLLADDLVVQLVVLVDAPLDLVLLGGHHLHLLHPLLR